MNPIKQYSLPVAAASMIVLIAVLVGCSACSPRWYYRFREEPTVAPTSDVSTDTDERESITDSHGYNSLNDK
ncbi:MAG: hypothetical protein II709_10350, partial [Ruminococcus sp.]|nr:hypothetical protein [Ruminococcus sp.]